MTKPRPITMAASALALFQSVLLLLTWQVRSGRDPALGVGHQQPALVAQAPQRVLVRKVVRRVIDEKVVERDDAPETVAVAPGSTTTVRSATPAVVYAAPAPAPAAPIVTKTS
jgi:hypothetical protein